MERPQLTAEIGANIRAARQTRGLALAAVAGKAGVSVATLSRMENGKQAVDAALLVVVATIIDTPPAVLLGGAVASANAEAVIASLVIMADDERRRVIRSAVEHRSRTATADELIGEVVADLEAAAEKLVAIKRAVKKSRRRYS